MWVRGRFILLALFLLIIIAQPVSARDYLTVDQYAYHWYDSSESSLADDNTAPTVAGGSNLYVSVRLYHSGDTARTSEYDLKWCSCVDTTCAVTECKAANIETDYSFVQLGGENWTYWTTPKDDCAAITGGGTWSDTWDAYRDLNSSEGACSKTLSPSEYGEFRFVITAPSPSQDARYKLGVVYAGNTELNAYTNIVEIVVQAPDTDPPDVNLVSPPNDTATSDSTVWFAANYTDTGVGLKNTTLWVWNSTNDVVNNTESRTITGASNSTNISVTLPYEDTFHWNYYACDDNNNCGWNATNWTFTVDTSAPLVYLESPANNTLNTTDSTPDFVFNVTDNLASTLDCILWLDSGTPKAYGQNSSTLNATSTTITANESLANDDYWWWINCTDSVNTNVSVEWNISIDVVNEPPNVTINSPENESTVANQDWALLNWSISEPESEAMEVWVYGSNDSSAIGGGNSLLYHRTGLSDGEYTYNWTARVIQPDSSTVLLFHMDNRSEYGENTSWKGTVYDFSGNGNNGSIGNITNNDQIPIWNETGRFGGAFEFNGTTTEGDSIFVPHSGSLNPGSGNWTVEFWVRYTNALDCDVIRKGSTNTHGTGGWWKVEISRTAGTSNQISFDWRESDGDGGSTYYTQTPNTYNDSEWHHVVARKNDSYIVMFVDGEVASTPATVSGSVSSTANLTIGSKDTQDDDFCNITLDELAVYNRSLPDSEIVNHYNLSYQKYYWQVNVTDGANYNDSGEYWFNLTAPDYPPIIDIVSPINKTYTTTTIDFNVSLNENGSWCGFSLNEAPNVTMTKFNETYFNFTNTSMTDEMQHNVIFACNDTAGNMNSSSGVVYFTVNTSADTTYPNVTLNEPENGTTLTDTNVTFNCTPRDNINLKNVTLYFESEGGGGGEIDLVQNKTNAHEYLDDGNYGITITLDSVATANNLLVTGIAIDKNATSITVPDGFTLVQEGIGTTSSGAMAYKVSDGTEQDITWNWTAIEEGTGWVGEYSGLAISDVLDVSAENESAISGPAVSSLSTGTTPTTTQADELAIAIFISDSGNSVGTPASWSWSNGFTTVAWDNRSSGSPYIHVANKTLTSTGTVESTFSHGGNDESYAVIATFKAAGGVAWHANETKNITGVENETIFEKNLTDNLTYNWNCYVCDAVDLCAFNDTNYTFDVNTSYIPADNPPTVTLNAPADTSNFSTNDVTFNCTASDNINVTNVTLWGNWSGWHANETNFTPINNTPVIFTKTIDDGYYEWSCEACDNSSNCAFNDTNWTFTVDTAAPLVYLESPANNTLNTTDNTPDFTFNVTDNLASTLDCILWLDNGTAKAYGQNDSTLNATSTTITANESLANDDYWWWINCTDGVNTNISEKWNISIDVVNLAPLITINDPDNESTVTNQDWALLNWSISEPESEDMEVWVWGTNDSAELDYNLLYHKTGLSDGEYTYNWTAPVFDYLRNDPSTVFYLRFDNNSVFGENDTYIYDYSGNGHNGTAAGSDELPVFTENAKFGGAFNFIYDNVSDVNDNNNSHFVISDSDDFAFGANQATTFMAWVFFNGSVADDHKLMSHSGTGAANSPSWDWGITDDTTGDCSGGEMRVKVNGSNQICSNSVTPLNQWIFVALTVSGTTASWYLNGQADGSDTIAAVGNPVHDLWIGEEGGSTALHEGWNGSIDEIIWLNRTLSASEIESYYNLSYQKYYWKVNVTDASSNTNSSGIYEFNLSEVDLTPPIITIVSPENTTYDTTTIDFNVSLNEDGDWCGFSLNEAPNVTMTKFNETYFNFTNSSMIDEMQHNVTFACNDTAGNMNGSSEIVYFMVNTSADVIAPNVTLNEPENGTTLTEINVTFNCTPRDNINLSNVTLYFKSSGGTGVGWIAYNDAGDAGNPDEDSHGNVTNIGDGEAPGNLVYYHNNSDTGIALNYNTADALEGTGAEDSCGVGVPCYASTGNASSDAAVEFGEIINVSSITYTGTGVDLIMTLDNLDSTKTYTLVVLGMRGNSDYTDRWCNYTIEAVDNFISAHSDGTIVSTQSITNDTSRYVCGYNYLKGYIAKWTNIEITTDNITVTVTNDGTSPKSYISAIKLVEETGEGVSWHANETKSISGVENETIFEKNLTDNLTYEWNCKVCDAVDLCDFNDTNYTFDLNTSYVPVDNPPSVNLGPPANATTKNYTTIDFNFTATDDYNLTNATLYFCNVTETETEQATYVEWLGNYSTWSYNDSNVTPASDWMNDTYDYSGWPTGDAYLCAESGGETCNTTMDNETSGYAYITYYFRRNFTVTNASKVVNMSFNIDYDDAYIVYINNYMINTSNGTCDWDTHSATCQPWHDSLLDAAPDDPQFPKTQLNSTHLGYLVDGENNISVAIKQYSTTSTDAVLMLRLEGYENQTVNISVCDSPFVANKTTNISGTTNSTNITQTLQDNQTYWWNIRVCDGANQCAFNATNFTLYVNTSYVPPPCSESGVSYTIEPYVMSWNQTTEKIRLKTNVSTNITIYYSTDYAYDNSISNSTYDTVHEITITSLSTNTIYNYKVTVYNTSGEDCYQNSTFNASFKTSDNSRNTFSFAVAGDTRNDGAPGVNQSAIQTIINNLITIHSYVEFLVIHGDLMNSDDGGSNSDTDYENYWHPNVQPFAKSKSIVATVGNHDEPRVAGWRTAWRREFMYPLNGDGEDNWEEYTYNWTYGNSLFILLNTEETSSYTTGNITGNQYTWFKNTLENGTSYQHKFVFAHKGIQGTSRSDTISGADPSWAGQLDQLMYDNNVTMGIYAHDHFYCYNTTQNGEMLHVISGGGGAPLRTNNCYGLYRQEYHYLVINVTDNVINGTAYYLNGTVMHTFSRIMPKIVNVSFKMKFLNDSIITSSPSGVQGYDHNISAENGSHKYVGPCLKNEPECQNVSLGVLRFNNTGNVATNWSVMLNQSLPSSIVLWGSKDSDPNTNILPINNTAWTVINESVCVYCEEEFWVWANFTDAAVADAIVLRLNNTAKDT